jgi:tetratricopeptide (TPR) repeat protein
MKAPMALLSALFLSFGLTQAWSEISPTELRRFGRADDVWQGDRIRWFRLAQARKQMNTAVMNIHDNAEADFTLGSTLLSQGRYAEAITAFQKGISLIGSSYARPEVIDDTNMKLLLAEDSLRKGNAKVAATLFSRVLESRLSLLAETK